MSIKLGKAFGTGNSFSNVKLIEQVVNDVNKELGTIDTALQGKADTATVTALQEAVTALQNGTLPVYEVTDTTDMDTLDENSKYPCVLNFDSHIVIIATSEHVRMLYGLSIWDDGYTYQWNITWNEGEKYEDTTPNEQDYATTAYVNDNKGTKLYKHELNVSITHTSSGQSAQYEGTLVLVSLSNLNITDISTAYEYILSVRGSGTLDIASGSATGTWKPSGFSVLPNSGNIGLGVVGSVNYGPYSYAQPIAFSEITINGQDTVTPL